MTFREALSEATAQLEKRHISEARSDAWLLMEFVWKINRNYYFMHSDDIIEDNDKERYRSLISRRIEHIPVQLLTNRAYFMGHEFYVNEDVLIPRLDTEVLIETVLPLIQMNNHVLDMCTGSGCVIISLLLEGGVDIKGTGVDISKEALAVAKRNATVLGTDVDFIESDLFTNVKGRYDIIVSNPPYIRSAVVADLMPEVREHEPLLALDGKADGLYFYREIITKSHGFLTDKGYLAFEIGYDQGDELIALMTDSNYQDIKVIKDLAGLDRVVVGQRR
jgi:protein-(glutamine-N5) methyltransferase, release factor-specific